MRKVTKKQEEEERRTTTSACRSNETISKGRGKMTYDLTAAFVCNAKVKFQIECDNVVFQILKLTLRTKGIRKRLR